MAPTKSRRKWRWLLIALALVVLAIGACLFVPPVERISTYYSRQIRGGMRRSQVEAILGGPPGDYRTPGFRLPDDKLMPTRPAGECWQGDRLSIYVAFDEDGYVQSVIRYTPGRMRPSWYQFLQDWLPLPD